MRLSLLLFVLQFIIKRASKTNRLFKHYIRKIRTRILIKTANGKQARLFIFDRGKVTSVSGSQQEFDVALVWQDAATGFSVMTNKRADAFFNAAADGKLKVVGMSVYAMWFEEGMKLII